MIDPDATPLPAPAPPPPQAGCRHGNVAYTLPGATAPMVCSSCSAEALEEGLRRVLDRVTRTDERVGVIVEQLPHLAIGHEVQRVAAALEQLRATARERVPPPKYLQTVEALRTEVAELRDRVLQVELRGVRQTLRWRARDLLVQLGGWVGTGRWVRVP